MNKVIAQNIIFITSTRLGDAILSTGILATLHERYPKALIEVVCGGLPAPLFEACPYVDKVHILKKTKGNKHWIDLWKIMWSKRWEVIVDLRNTAFSRLCFAGKTYIFDHRIAQDQHKIRQFQALVKGDAPPMPVLWPQNGKRWIAGGAPVLALGPSSNWHAKTWPAERFIELIRRLRAGPMQGWRLAIFAAADERAQIQPVLDAFPDAIDMVGKGSPADVVDALSVCDFYIGNDSGLMQMAAALGLKTLGLFGPTDDIVYGPWGAKTGVVRTPESMAQLLDIPDYCNKTCANLMQSLDVDTVEKAALSLFDKD